MDRAHTRGNPANTTARKPALGKTCGREISVDSARREQAELRQTRLPGSRACCSSACPHRALRGQLPECTEDSQARAAVHGHSSCRAAETRRRKVGRGERRAEHAISRHKWSHSAPLAVKLGCTVLCGFVLFLRGELPCSSGSSDSSNLIEGGGFQMGRPCARGARTTSAPAAVLPDGRGVHPRRGEHRAHNLHQQPGADPTLVPYSFPRQQV